VQEIREVLISLWARVSFAKLSARWESASVPGGVRATSHTRLRARDHYISSTLIGGKGGAGPNSLLHITLEGPTEYVNAWWM
jgi:hypothetical protein